MSGSSCRCAPRSAPRCARTARRPAPRHFLVHCLLDGGADVLVDQDSEGDLLMHELQLLDSLAYGAFLRSSPWPATGWWFPNRKNAPFSFSTSPGTRPGYLEAWLRSVTKDSYGRIFQQLRSADPRCATGYGHRVARLDVPQQAGSEPVQSGHSSC